ncbi:MAG: hypothetical protein NC910_01590 [Candidatus Omnitrophica bacterium]|nr:hypothetical protein [Candidatus Omnitrophota bacterium]
MVESFTPKFSTKGGAPAVLVYARYYTTSIVLIRALEQLFKDSPEVPKEIRFHVVLDDRRDLPMARKALPASVSIHLQYDAIQPYRDTRKWPEETVSRWEKSYGSPHLRSFLWMERALEGRPEGVKWRYLLCHLDYFEKLWKEIHPSLYITGAADGLLPWTAMTVMKANGVPVLCLGPSRFGKKIFVMDNAYEHLDIGAVYQRIRREGLLPEQRQQAVQLVEEYRRASVKPVDYIALQGRLKRRRLLPNPFSAIRLARDAFCTDAGNFDMPLRASLERALKARRTALYNHLLASTQTAVLPEAERFFFFPLQYEPEISLSTQGRGWHKQLELVKWISQSLPIDRWLYVKEHPSMLSGIRPLRFYREILSLPRVRLLKQSINSFEIVPKAEAVLTITGTAGWEALMFGRPVVLLGHAFYEEFAEGVTRLESRETLPAILLDMRRKWFAQEDLLAYITAVMTKTRDGFFFDPRLYPEMIPDGLGEKNLRNIAAVLREKLPQPVLS